METDVNSPSKSYWIAVKRIQGVIRTNVDEKWFYTNPTSVSFKWVEMNKVQLEREYRQKAGDSERRKR